MTSSRPPVVVGIAEKQPAALRFALGEAKRCGTDLHVVHSYPLPAQAAEFYIGTDVLRTMQEEGRAILDDARRFIEHEMPDVHVEYVLEGGSPVELLMRSSMHAQLLVVGADDINWLDRVMRGEVASVVAREAPCPVVVVPESAAPVGEGGDIVLTLDGESAAAGPLTFAFERAQSTGSVLHVLHAVPPATRASDEIAHAANVAELLAGWSERYPDVRVQSSITRNDPAEAAIEATRQASLVVAGRPRGVQRPFAMTKPVAVTVLRHAHCPVAVVPSVLPHR